MGMLRRWQLIFGGKIASLTLIRASVSSWTVQGWLMCLTECRKWAGHLITSVPSSASSCWHKLLCTSRNPLSPASAHVSVLLPGCEQGLHAALMESVSGSLGRNMDTREQKAILMLECCIPMTPWPLLLYLSVHWYLINVLETMLWYKENDLSRDIWPQPFWRSCTLITA